MKFNLIPVEYRERDPDMDGCITLFDVEFLKDWGLVKKGEKFSLLSFYPFMAEVILHRDKEMFQIRVKLESA